MKKITFIMPTYNSAEYLERTLKSLSKMIAANKDDAEVLFVDDGSTDHTLRILEDTVSKDPDTYRLYKAKHGGVSKVRNIGIENATGEYLTFIDSDDLYAENFIPIFLHQAKEKPDLIWEDVHGLKQPILKTISNKYNRVELMGMVLGLDESFIQEGIASKFYRRDFLLENNLKFNEEIVVSEDTLFILEAIDKAKSAYFSNFEFYKILEEHSLSRFNEKVLAGELEYEDKVEQLLADYPTQKKKIMLRIKLNGAYTLLRRYYGAKCLRGEMNLKEATKAFKKNVQVQQYREAFLQKNYDKIFSIRYRLLRILLKYRMYRLAILLDIELDKVKGSTWK